MTELLNTLMNTNPVHLFLAVGIVLTVCSGASGSVEEDDNSDYENASWNPSSVNYNGGCKLPSACAAQDTAPIQ